MTTSYLKELNIEGDYLFRRSEFDNKISVRLNPLRYHSDENNTHQGYDEEETAASINSTGHPTSDFCPKLSGVVLTGHLYPYTLSLFMEHAVPDEVKKFGDYSYLVAHNYLIPILQEEIEKELGHNDFLILERSVFYGIKTLMKLHIQQNRIKYSSTKETEKGHDFVKSVKYAGEAEYRIAIYIDKDREQPEYIHIESESLKECFIELN